MRSRGRSRARKPPWTCRAPFGLPVVPEVYARRYGASLSTSTASSTPGCFATASSHHASRSAVIGHSTPARRQTRTLSTLGASASASSRTAFIGTTFPRRYDASAVRTSLAPASASREDTAGPAKPEKIGTCTAPMCAHACDAIAASGAIGRNVPTASPSPTPSSCSASASVRTSCDNSAHVNERRSPSSGTHTAASASGISDAQR